MIEATLREHIDRFRVGRNVRLIGSVSRSELTTLMRVHAALALPWASEDCDRALLANLVLTGTAALNGTGNALDNVIIGNESNNVITGGDTSACASNVVTRSRPGGDIGVPTGRQLAGHAKQDPRPFVGQVPLASWEGDRDGRRSK